MKPEITIVNIVVTGKFGDDIDLKWISKKLDNIRYNPKLFPGLTLNINDPQAVILVFRSGKFVCTGAKSRKDAETAIKNAIETLQRIGIDIKLEYMSVQNIVATANFHSEINLMALALVFLEDIEYEPEQFPGLFYRCKDPNAVILVFSSGKTVITGCKSEEEVVDVAMRFYDNLLTFGLI